MRLNFLRGWSVRIDSGARPRQPGGLMKNKMMSITTLGLISVFFVSTVVKAEDAVVAQDQLQTRDKLQAQDQVREQDQLKVQEKLRTKEQVQLKNGKDVKKPAKDAVKDQDKLQTMDKLETRDQVREQDQLKIQEKLQTKEQAGKDVAEPADAERAALQKQEKTRLMKGAENAKGEAVRESAGNAGEGKALKNRNKTGAGDEKELKKQERRQERKKLRTKAHSSVDRGAGSESRAQNRGASGKGR